MYVQHVHDLLTQTLLSFFCHDVDKRRPGITIPILVYQIHRFPGILVIRYDLVKHLLRIGRSEDLIDNVIYCRYRVLSFRCLLCLR